MGVLKQECLPCSGEFDNADNGKAHHLLSNSWKVHHLLNISQHSSVIVLHRVGMKTETIDHLNKYQNLQN